MKRRRPLSATSRPGWCTNPSPRNEVGEIYNLGYAAGMADGASLTARLADGDEDLADRLRDLRMWVALREDLRDEPDDENR